MADARPPKRVRTKEPEAEPPVQRSSRYWLEDGNVILQVQSTQFRLHKSFLAIHSSVFRDMFSLPLPAEEPLIEGCPLVVLHGDTSEDWAHLLDAMFPNECFVDNPPLLDAVGGILRLSKKYDVPAFRKRCLERLREEFPTTLEEFDKDIASISHPGGMEFSEMCAHSVNLAREVGVFSMLPSALYYLIRQEPGVFGEHISILDSVQDKLAAYKAYAEMSRDYCQTPLQWLKPSGCIPSPSCSTRDECERRRNGLFIDLIPDPTIVASIVDFWNEEDKWEEGLCEPCVTEAKELYEKMRKECWEKLPSYFGLPSWEELKKMDLE
ncbi:BTB domain-containing protein [Mycena chlorophos]|uniref:BTB domain-containing protein n=1 Tax=Mycena chlorophos TaxID=658473 RepID=A0A8H6VWF0_MYCCL|nr:BTB domain-containing protein [Mycena chlorophos]